MMKQFGKLEIPWVCGILLAGGWSLGSIMINPVQYFVPSEDKSAYICYFSSGVLFCIIASMYALKNRKSFSSSYPKFKIFIFPLIISTVIMILPWAITGYILYYSNPYIAIAVLTALSVIHAFLMTILVKENR